jgi:serine/threonine protein kinase
MKFTYPSGATPLDGYTIKRGIGIGGFGEVYFALNDAGKEVALKKIQRNLDIELRGVRQCFMFKHWRTPRNSISKLRWIFFSATSLPASFNAK